MILQENMKYSRLLFASGVLALSACNPQRNAESYAPAKPEETSAAAPKVSPSIPEPVKQFDELCYRTEAQFDRVSRVAKARGLEKASGQLQELLSSGKAADGDSYVITFDQDNPQVMVLGLGKNGTCAVFAAGYGADDVEASLKTHFRLLEVASDDMGLQVATMYVPDGTTQMISEAHEKGIVFIMRSKPGATDSGDEIILTYAPPAVAKATLQ